jgi:hypothetical protein
MKRILMNKTLMEKLKKVNDKIESKDNSSIDTENKKIEISDTNTSYNIINFPKKLTVT